MMYVARLIEDDGSVVLTFERINSDVVPPDYIALRNSVSCNIGADHV